MQKDPLWKKCISSLVAGTTVVALLLELGNSGLIPWFPPVIVFSLAAVALLVSIVFLFAWQYRQRRYGRDAGNVYAFLYSIIRYATAFDLAIFGWKKIFRLQFLVPRSIAHLPMDQQSGEWLTWFYFGHSRVFVLILAVIQLLGAWFLLFRRTMLLAAIVLFAFMMNLLLVNIFYGMNAGALTQSVLVTISIGFLILLEYQRLIDFFLRTAPAFRSLPFSGRVSKNIGRISVIVLSLLYVMYIASL